MERAVDGNNITLCQHLLQVLNTTASNLLLDLRLERLVIEVQQFLAVEWLQSSQDTLTNSSDSNGTDDLTLKIELVLGGSGNVPFSGLDLLVCRDEVTDEDENRHDNVLSDRDDVRAGDFGDGDTAVGLVGGVQVDVVGPDTGCDGELEFLGFGETFGG